MNTNASHWICDRCGAAVPYSEYHVCWARQTTSPVASWPTYQPNYLPTLERIEQSLLRIEKLLEKEL